MQWHPIFAKLLRPLVEEYFDIQVNVPVGDLPREADIVLLRRTSYGTLPFRGLWKNLTSWNIVEFKGPTVSARRGDLDLLIELGLGIHRRLNERRSKQNREAVPRDEVSMWYLANHLGSRFLREAENLVRPLERLANGLWRCRALGRVVFLVSARQLPVETESLPLHVLSREARDVEREMARLIIEQPSLWRSYGDVLATLHPAVLEELRAMVRTKKQEFKFHFEPIIDLLGMEEVVAQIGIKRLIDEVGLKRVVDEIGLKRVVDEIGLKRVVDEIGLKRVVDHLGVDALVEGLTPAQKRELKRKLE
jgi:hypothetical protein